MHEITLTPERIARLRKSEAAHKYDHGHLLVLGGASGRGGAARLGARAGLRVGAGLVTLLVPQVALWENAAHLTSVMVETLPDSYTLRGMLQDPRKNALLLGPGLGQARARDMVPAALWGARPTVLDADALSVYEDDPATLFNQLHPACILTPHMGEFARLFPDLATLERSDAAQKASARAGCTLLLKGTQTLIATPDHPLSALTATGPRAAPWLATAGSGDVLAGLIAGLLARGLSPHEAAETGALLHIEAGQLCGAGLISEDLPEAIPKVFAALGV